NALSSDRHSKTLATPTRRLAAIQHRSQRYSPQMLKLNCSTKHRNFSLIIVLCAVYTGTVLLQGGTKLVLNIYRSWVGERAVRDLRRRVHVLVSSSSAAASGPEAEGIQASMIVAEVESIGG